MIDSVWCEPYLAIWAIAPETPSTIFTEMMASRYSVDQSASLAGFARGSAAHTSASPRTSQPAAIRSSSTGLRWVAATLRSTSRVSAAPQMPGRRILAFSVTLRAMSRSAAPSM